MPFTFVEKVDLELLQRTRGAWMAQLDSNPENTSATYYEAGLEFCERTVKEETAKQFGGGCVCAVVEDGSEYASGLFQVSHAKAKSEVRMLEVYVQPDLNLADAEPSYERLGWIAATAIVGLMDLTYGTYPAQQIKLHTAFPLDKPFMIAVTTAIFGKGDLGQDFEVKSQGNWIVVSKRPRAIAEAAGPAR